MSRTHVRTGRHWHDPPAAAGRPFEGACASASGLLLLESLHPLFEGLDTVLERLDRAGDFPDVLGRSPGLFDRRPERLYSPLEDPLLIADRRHTARRRRLAELALEAIDAILEPLDAHPTGAPPIRVADIIEQRP